MLQHIARYVPLVLANNNEYIILLHYIYSTNAILIIWDISFFSFLQREHALHWKVLIFYENSRYGAHDVYKNYLKFYLHLVYV